MQGVWKYLVQIITFLQPFGRSEKQGKSILIVRQTFGASRDLRILLRKLLKEGRCATKNFDWGDT